MRTLSTYRRKRDFEKTAEPRGAASSRASRASRAKGTAQASSSSFVVQKHEARRLHYDFRLELDGVLLSWAVPKGPSIDPRVKRLAQQTEDHPLEYGGFEGTIPKGQYGGGTVMLWDRGTWLSVGDPRARYEKGHLEFELRGERLKGRWHLVRTGRDGGKSWLLFKGRDEQANADGDRLLYDAMTSVASARSMEEIARGDSVWGSETSKVESSAPARHRRGARVREVPRSAPRQRSAKASERGATPGLPKLTNPTKVLYPADGITKKELLDYYVAIHERMLPHVVDRPLTLVRCPEGIEKSCFFQKHVGKGRPETLRPVSIAEKSKTEEYLTLDDASGLYALVQLGALEVHTWGSRALDVERPDILVFDLDPDPDLPWSAVTEAATLLRRLFEELDLTSFVKTTGGKGLHVCVPIRPQLEWEEVKDFARNVAESLALLAPERYVAVMSKARRKGKVFVDYLRNGRGATFIAPYSARARQGATVAMPIDWKELASAVPGTFHVRNVPERLRKQRKDPWNGIGEVEQRLTAARVRSVAKAARKA